jgi:adenylate cyclase
MAVRITKRLGDAFEREERDGERLAIKGRTIALLVIAILLFFVVPFPDLFYYQALLAVLLVLGLLHAWLLRTDRHRAWHGYAFAAIDFAVLSFTLIYPNPFATVEYTAPLGLRFGSFVYFFVPLCGLAFAYRPRVMIFGGLVGALIWSVGVAWVGSLPGTNITVSPDWPIERIIETILAPNYVDVSVQIQRIVVFLIVAGLLAVIVTRSRRLVQRQARSERERGNLARHFPPSMVDRLATMDAPLAQVREQKVAVLFADVVGFTRWSENRSPIEVIAYLRQVHTRFERAVFENGGTLDKFIGDGVMATFGTPEADDHDAANGLRTVRSILAEFDAWNADRARRGKGPIGIGIGLHYGTVVTGDIGSERRLEFAVLGDAVNVASRLERLTRDIGCRAAISQSTLNAIRDSEDDDVADDLLRGLGEGPVESIRGRQESVRLWTL